MIITDVDGKAHEYIVKVETGADGMRTIYFPSAESVAEAADILNAADEANKEAEMDFETATDKEIEDNWGDNLEASETIKAEITGTSIDIYAYDVENDRPTTDEVKAAIAAELKKTNPAVTAADVTIDGVKVTVKGETQDYTLNLEYKALFKVTVNSEAAQYIKTGGTVTVKDEKITNVLPSGKKVGALGDTKMVDETKHTFTFDGKKDTEYKTALKLAGKIENGVSYTLQYNDGTKTAENWKNLTLGYYIQAGVGIAVIGANVSGEVAATVNKVEGKATAVNGTVVIKFLDGVTAYAKDDEGEDETEIKISIGGMTYTVNWNGTPLTTATKTKWAKGDKIPLTTSQIMDGAKYIVGKSKGGDRGDITPTTDANGTSFILNDAAIDGAKDGVIDIYPAFVVKDAVGTNVEITDKATGKDAITFADGQAKLVAAGTKLVMTAAAKNTLIGAKENNTDKWTDADLTLVTKPMANNDTTTKGKAIYEVTLTKDIDATNDFEVSKKAIAPSGSNAGTSGNEIVLGSAKGVTDDTAVWTLVAGTPYVVDGGNQGANTLDKANFLNLGKGTELNVRWQTGTDPELLKLNVTAKVTEEDIVQATMGQDTITFTVTSASGTAKVALGDADLTGTLVVTVGDEFQFEVKVKVAKPGAAKSETHTADPADKEVMIGADGKVTSDGTTEVTELNVTAATVADTTWEKKWQIGTGALIDDDNGFAIDPKAFTDTETTVTCYLVPEDGSGSYYADKVEFTVVVFPKETPTPSATTASAAGDAAGKVITFTLPEGCTVAPASTDSSSDEDVATIAAGSGTGGIKVTPKKAGEVTLKVTVTHTTTGLTQDYTFTFNVEA